MPAITTRGFPMDRPIWGESYTPHVPAAVLRTLPAIETCKQLLSASSPRSSSGLPLNPFTKNQGA